MTYEELKQAAKVFYHIRQIRDYVSKERFVMVAKTRFGIDDERRLDVMYGLLNMTPRLVYYIAHEDNEAARQTTRWPKYMKLMPEAIEIAESAYSLKPKEWGGDSMPHVNHDEYRKEDKRRYFYTEDGKEKMLDVDLCSRSGITLLSEVLQRDNVKIVGVAEHLGYLEGKMNGNSRERFQYFDGDIYFLYGDPTDRVFYDWYSHGGDAGVYVATEKGWRKLLYTPGRGYVDKRGCVDFIDDKHFYSEYMLEKSGMGFQYVGSLHCNPGVLWERKQEKKKED